MKIIILLIFIGFINCNNSQGYITKDYSIINNEALSFCKENNFNEDYYFLLDFSIHSGKNRFFIYDFKNKIIIEKKLVTHGSCDVFHDNQDKWENAIFSSKKDSHCSMKGKYKIGSRDYSSWGINIKYWLHGLEESNKTAVDRVVVLHSWDVVKNEEIYPNYSPLSWGCPAVSNEFMKNLDERLSKSSKPVLLWIIE